MFLRDTISWMEHTWRVLKMSHTYHCFRWLSIVFLFSRLLQHIETVVDMFLRLVSRRFVIVIITVIIIITIIIIIIVTVIIIVIIIINNVQLKF